jgi:hypothetical protein
MATSDNPNATAIAFVMLIPDALAQALMETQMIRASNDCL